MDPKDHVFPQKLFLRSALKKAGLSDDEVDAYRLDMNRLANLHLLPGLVNQEKSGMLPSLWASQHIADDKRQNYLDQYDLQDLPEELSGFPLFYTKRRAVFRKRLAALLQKRDDRV